MGLFTSKPQSGWQSETDQPRVTARQRLKAEYQRSSSSVTAPARAALGDASSRWPVRLVTLGEIIVEASVSPIGRVVTATVALTGAFLLLQA